jgi:undecaprenyl-diphosphatase
MNALQAAVLAILQGVTELFPISSLGHAVILPKLLHWSVNENSDSFLPFLVVLHLGTALALLLFFWRDWYDILLALIGKGPDEERARNQKLFLLVVVATIPAGLIGLALQNYLEKLFGAPLVAATFLAINGVVLLVGERRRKKAGYRVASDLSWGQAIVVGVSQSAALIPGISRSGSTIVAGLWMGLRHEEAARFSFLMATPIITAAGLLEVPKLMKQGSDSSVSLVLFSGVLAAVAAFLSVAFLMRYFHKRDFQALNPFAYYCLAAGILSFILISAGV